MRGLLCVVLLAIGIAQGQEREPGRGVNFYSKDKEIALGQRLAAEYRRQTTPLDNAAVRDYVKRVGANVASQFPGCNYQIETIREDLGGSTHEPAAFPGGFIFVSEDLIAAAGNEAEFAGMLAHAMAHVAARHWTRLATKYELMTSDPMGEQWPAAYPPERVPLGMFAMQRAAEREADYLAVKAMASVGYDPAGLASYVGRVQPATGHGSVSAAFATLPPRDQRVGGIQAEIRKLPARAYQTSDEFARIQAEVKGQPPTPPSIKK